MTQHGGFLAFLANSRRKFEKEYPELIGHDPVREDQMEPLVDKSDSEEEDEVQLEYEELLKPTLIHSPEEQSTEMGDEQEVAEEESGDEQSAHVPVEEMEAPDPPEEEHVVGNVRELKETEEVEAPAVADKAEIQEQSTEMGHEQQVAEEESGDEQSAHVPVEADAEVDGKKSGLGWLYASTVAVGRTLRSPMRGARSLAEGLRSRANTGEKEDEAAAATSVAGPAALNSAGAAPELERARQRAKRAAQRPKRSHLEQFPAKDDAEEAEEEDAEEDALQEPDAPDAPAEPMESAAPAEEPKTETSMPEEVARPTKRAKTEEAESKAEVQAAETSPKKTTAALPTESPRATTEAVQPLEPAVFDVDPLGEPLEGPLDEEESEEPCEVGDMKEQLARRRKRLESQLFATGKRRKKSRWVAKARSEG